MQSEHQCRAKSLGIVIDKPVSKEYAVLTKRIESFNKWPSNAPANTEELAEAGFVYTGVKDIVRCYYCDGEVRHWNDGDIPLRAHARFYPECPHVSLVAGKQYIQNLRPPLPNLVQPQVVPQSSSWLQVMNLDSETDDDETLVREHSRLKESITCKECHNKLADIIFLPCGHIVSCAQCAPALTKCPMCPQRIHGFVKARFAVEPKTDFSSS